jgi:hypothetical protein
MISHVHELRKQGPIQVMGWEFLPYNQNEALLLQ